MQVWQVSPDGRLNWTRVDEPQRRPGDSIVDVTVAGICGSDVAKLTKAVIPTPPGQPWQPGHEISGQVDGIPVAVDPLVPCGACGRCDEGRINECPDLQMIGWHRPGGFAPKVTVPSMNIVELPEGLDEHVAVLAEPTAVAIHGVRCGLRRPRHRDSLAVVGSGTLAVASAAYATTRGWDTTLLARNPSKFTGVELPFRVRPLLYPLPDKYDAVIDAAGGADDTSFVHALDVVVDGGTIVAQTAYYPGVRLSRDLRDLIRRGLTIVGSFSFCCVTGNGDFNDALTFLARDDRWTSPFLAHPYPLDELPRALGELQAPPGLRPNKAVLTI